MTITRRRFIAGAAAAGAALAVADAVAVADLFRPAALPVAPQPATRTLASLTGFGFELGDTVRLTGSSASDGIYRVAGTAPLQLWDGRYLQTVSVRGRDFHEKIQ